MARLLFTYKLIFLFIALCFMQTATALDSKDILRPEEAFKLSAAATTPEQLELTWNIAEGYHLYQDRFKFQSQTEEVPLGQITMPEGKTEHDAVFGEVVVYRNAVNITVPLQNVNNARQIKLFVKYQGCADVGVCYPPQKVVLDLDLPEKALAPEISPQKPFLQGFRNLAPGLFQNDLLPAEQAFQFFASVKNDHTLHVSWLAAEGYYLYKDKLTLSLDSPNQDQLGKLSLPVGEGHNDPEFGQVEIYRRETVVDVDLLRQNPAAETLTLTAKYQGCADRGVCYPPMQSSITLALPVATTPAAIATAPATAVGGESEQDRIVSALKQDGLGLTLLTFFGFGLLLAFTPCIFPMIPILSGIIVGHGHQISTRKAFLLSLSYVVASALMYTLFGILAALFGSNLQATFQNPWIIGVFSAIFVGLSLSMFGFYHLELPKSLQAVLHNSSEKHRDGSYLGAGIMGALSSLIVGPCVAAPLAAALVFIGQTGDVLLGGSALFAMGLGMGVPLLLLGASAGKLLPKAGEWLNATKAVFGVIMLGLALWMLSRILSAAVTMLLSAMLLILPAIFLSAIDPLPASASGWRKLWKGLGVMLLVFGILQLIGLSTGKHNLLQPLEGLALGNQAQAKATGLTFQRVRSVAELDARIKQAAANKQPVMLDFYADWCVSCKEMEAYTFTDPKVLQQLANHVLLQADVTENNDADKALLQRFNLIGPPGIIFFDADGQEKAASRVIGYQDAGAFLQTIQK